MGVWYTTREDVQSALDSKSSALSNAQVDRAVEAASRAVEGFLHRTFAPVLATKYFDYPNHQYARAWRLWLEDSEVVSVTTLTSGGTTIPSTDYFLEPVNDGPPYDRIEINLANTSAFSSSTTRQHATVVTGVFAGCPTDETSVGTAAEALDASETGLDVDGATSALVGVGSVLRIDSERFLVTERAALDTTQNLGGSGLTAVDNDVSVPVSTGSAFGVGEVILIDSERMKVTDIAGNTLTVVRAWDGTTLATHATNADIYAYRTLTVTRGALGTTAATHLTAAPVYRLNIPGPVRELAMAEALNNLLQARSGYARTAGSGDNEAETKVLGLEALRTSVRRSHGRKARIGAV